MDMVIVGWGIYDKALGLFLYFEYCSLTIKNLAAHGAKVGGAAFSVSASRD